MDTTSSQVINKYKTLTDVLLSRRDVSDIGVTFIRSETEEEFLSYRELYKEAQNCLHYLQDKGLKAGDDLIIQLEDNKAFVTIFWACILGGIHAVQLPIAPNETLSKLFNVWKLLDNPYLFTSAKNQEKLEGFLNATNSSINTEIKNKTLIVESIEKGNNTAKIYAAESTDVAFIQFSSGSTGTPKGVAITHANVTSNIGAILNGHQCSQEDRHLSWMPLTQNSGLIGFHLCPMAIGATQYLMQPTLFVVNPVLWLQKLSEYKIQVSASPNFGFKHVLNNLKPEQAVKLNLSCIRIIMNGSEPISSHLARVFMQALAKVGLKKEAMYPVYGMTEATLAVTLSIPGEEFVSVKLDRKFTKYSDSISEVKGHEDGIEYTAVGVPLRDCEVKIADKEGNPSKDRIIGEIWVNGPQVATHYYKNEEASKSTFTEGWLKTGDLGFFLDGKLYVTGRIKEIIFINGQNFYPHDLEAVTGGYDVSLLGKIAFCGVPDDVTKKDELVLFVHYEESLDKFYQLSIDLKTFIAKKLGISIQAVIPIGAIPKTASGKIARFILIDRYKQGEFEEIKKSLLSFGKEQLSKSSLQSKVSRVRVVDSLYNPVYNYSWYSNEVESNSNTSVEASKKSADDLIQWVRQYAAERINPNLIDERRSIPPYIVLDMGNNGLLGMQIPKKYGGLEINNYDQMRVFEQLAAIDQTITSFVGINNVLGIRPILNYASDDVKEEMLPILASGRELAAFAITEPGAGSNPRNIAARAVPAGQNQWVLNGTKVWSGSASWAGMVNVFAKNINENGDVNGVSAFVVRQGTKGLRQGPEALTMGMRGMVQNTVYLENLLVSGDQALGKIGRGIDVAQSIMSYGRLSIGAAAIGAMKRCAQLMVRYGKNRSISTGKLLDNPVSLIRLSELSASITAVETLVHKTAKILDAGGAVPADIYAACKTSAPEFLYRATDQLVQMLGGRGYIETNYAPQFLRDARLLRIFEGPTETLLMFMGSSLIHKNQDLYDFMSKELGAPKVALKLRNAIEEIERKWAGNRRCFADGNNGVQWSYILAGETATYYILQAAVEGEIAATKETQALVKASTWCRLQAEEKLRQALEGIPSESIVYDAPGISDLISGFSSTIGDVDFSLPGEDKELDILLKKNTTVQNPGIAIPEISAATKVLSEVKESVPSSNGLSIQKVEGWLSEWVARAFNLPENKIDPQDSFISYGMDSVLAVKLSVELSSWIDCPLNATIIWNYPSIQTLSKYLVNHGGQRTGSSQSMLTPSEVNQAISSKTASEVESLNEDELAQLLASEIYSNKKK